MSLCSFFEKEHVSWKITMDLLPHKIENRYYIDDNYKELYDYLMEIKSLENLELIELELQSNVINHPERSEYYKFIPPKFTFYYIIKDSGIIQITIKLKSLEDISQLSFSNEQKCIQIVITFKDMKSDFEFRKEIIDKDGNKYTLFDIEIITQEFYTKKLKL